MNETAARVLALWCPDWPAVAAAAAADLPATAPVAVVLANRVIACSATARTEGVRRGLRRREAQARCPRVHVAAADEDRDARLFEPVTTAIDAAAPGVEVLRPGLLVLSARGVVRYFGSEQAAAERLVDAAAAAGVECQIGVADELSTAVIAARHGTLISRGKGAEFLRSAAGGGVGRRTQPRRPGADRPRRPVAPPGLAPHRRLRGADPGRCRVPVRGGRGARTPSARAEPERPPSPRALPPDLEVIQECDPPIDRVDAAAFAGRALAERLHARLTDAGVACTRLLVQASTARGEQLVRTWRCAEPLTPEGTADRIRWQLDGWLTGRSETRPTAGVVLLRLEPVEVVTAGALQLGLWGGVGEADERARRALVRVQGLLGGDAVRSGVLSGGRGPGERVTLVPFGDELVPAADPTLPWPGRLPAPAPATVFDERPVVTLTDRDGTAVDVTDRGEFTATPAVLSWGNRQWRLRGWAGPWPVDERWWDVATAHRAARAQVLLEEPKALLLVCHEGVWSVEGSYE